MRRWAGRQIGDSREGGWIFVNRQSDRVGSMMRCMRQKNAGGGLRQAPGKITRGIMTTFDGGANHFVQSQPCRSIEAARAVAAAVVGATEAHTGRAEEISTNGSTVTTGRARRASPTPVNGPRNPRTTPPRHQRSMRSTSSRPSSVVFMPLASSGPVPSSSGPSAPLSVAGMSLRNLSPER